MERRNIPFTNEHFVEFIKKMLELKSPYWYATCIFKCTESRYNSKKRQCPEHYTSDRTARYKADIAAKRISADCVGACKGYAWTNAGEGVIEAYGTDKTFTNKSGAHSCPDKSANGMFTWAKSKGAEWGPIKTLPEIVGIALRFDGHIGYYIGGGYAIEWRGFAYGCVKTKVSGRKWTEWYKLPFLDYGEGALVDNGSKTYKLGDRVLQKGSKGSDVKELQTALQRLGYNLGSYGVDGDFGSFTMAALVGFQQFANLPDDGIYDANTHEAMMQAIGGAVIEPDAPDVDDTPDDEPATEPDAPAVEPEAGQTVEITGSSVNIRFGNGTEYASMSIAHTGDRYPLVATALNGWYAVKVELVVGWVSPKYSVIK